MESAADGKGCWFLLLGLLGFGLLNPLQCAAVSVDLSLTVTDAPDPIVVGGNLTYTLVVTNKGPDAATGTVLSNSLPPSVIVNSMTVTNGESYATNGVFVCLYSNLAAGDSITAQLVVTPVNLQPLTNRVQITSDGVDSDSANNIRYALTTVLTVAPTADMKVRRYRHTGTCLQDGRVLLAGGITNNLSNPGSSAEIYDPSTDTFTWTGPMSIQRYSHTASLLADGRVVVVGGTIASGVSTPSIDLFDPTNTVFVPGPNLSVGRVNQTATVLPDGKVVIAGGASNSTTDIEIYNPVSGTISLGGHLAVHRSSHCAVLLDSGKILFVAGTGGASSSAELYDPAAQVSTLITNMTTARTTLCASKLLSGQVLITSGNTAELFDPVSQSFSATGSPTQTRNSGRAVLLNDGRALVTGGSSPLGYLSSVDAYDPVAGTFTSLVPMTSPRWLHTCVKLLDGRVFLAGGFNGKGLTNTEMYVLTIDVDRDGMEDSWELGNGFSPANRYDAIEDADHDGHTNLQEFLAGTDPHDPNSVMRISTVDVGGGAIRIDFTSASGKRYAVERTTDFAGQNWETVTNGVPGTGALVRIFDTHTAGQSRLLYRVKLLR